MTTTFPSFEFCPIEEVLCLQLKLEHLCVYRSLNAHYVAATETEAKSWLCNEVQVRRVLSVLLIEHTFPQLTHFNCPCTRGSAASMLFLHHSSVFFPLVNHSLGQNRLISRCKQNSHVYDAILTIRCVRVGLHLGYFCWQTDTNSFTLMRRCISSLLFTASDNLSTCNAVWILATMALLIGAGRSKKTSYTGLIAL